MGDDFFSKQPFETVTVISVIVFPGWGVVVFDVNWQLKGGSHLK
jgi:hypothetical protein